MKMSEIPKYLKEAREANRSVGRAAWEMFRQFQFNINLGDILLVCMLAAALSNLYILDTENFPWFINRNPAVIQAQRCSQLLNTRIENLDAMTDPGCTITMVCPKRNYTAPDFSWLNRTAVNITLP